MGQGNKPSCRAAATRASGEAAPEGSPSAHTHVLGYNGKLRANATHQRGLVIKLLTSFGRRCLDSDEQSDL